MSYAFLAGSAAGKRYSGIIHGEWGGRKEEALKIAPAFLCSRDLRGGSGKRNKILPTCDQLLIYWVPTAQIVMEKITHK